VELAGPEAAKLAAAAVLLSPYVPLLFMGEEYGETAPFRYFTDFSDPALREAVSRGRRQEFAAFGWEGEVPDPQDPETFAASRLRWERREAPVHRGVLAYYRRLLTLRRTHPALGARAGAVAVRRLDDVTLAVTRRAPGGSATLQLMRFAGEGGRVRVPAEAGRWRRLLDAAVEEFDGRGAGSPPELRGGETEMWLGPHASVLYGQEPAAATT
jgi:maltooligosyltrehalose trehalohydrolase